MDFNALMKKTAAENAGKKLLLHACCAPCSSAAIERLKEYFDITVFYFNPNIDDRNEYTLRLNEERRFCENFGIPVINGGYSPDFFYNEIKIVLLHLVSLKKTIKMHLTFLYLHEFHQLIPF